ncbi:DUF2971 domain-containing protein [Lachnoclostridium sp. Marseille-P6806]|uniref:DUF2971 domain-containing protein n=1 Tax=Lachnoclostridium sp. Marseille-P6806 TaxID=2364793 RepID=UPI001030F617|nr:DUF2971 domain-containing protein [Lachnoclostridium sp. Marseille-P6806]
MNDPTEFQVATEIFEEIIRKHIKSKSGTYKFVRKFKKFIEKDSSLDHMNSERKLSGEYVISFSLKEDSPLMWSEFSDFYGYCIRFDFEKMYKAMGGQFIFHGKVIYDHDEQIQIAPKALKTSLFCSEEYPAIVDWVSLESAEDEQMDRMADWASAICMLCNMFFKKKCFEGEAEYRFVFMELHEKIGGKMDSLPIRFRIRNESLVPYVEKALSDISCIESVTVGPKNNTDISIEGLRWFYRSKHLEVEIKRSEMPLRY